jgi:hypothetical protein
VNPRDIVTGLVGEVAGPPAVGARP